MVAVDWKFPWISRNHVFGKNTVGTRVHRAIKRTQFG